MVQIGQETSLETASKFHPSHADRESTVERYSRVVVDIVKQALELFEIHILDAKQGVSLCPSLVPGHPSYEYLMSATISIPDRYPYRAAYQVALTADF